MVRTTEMNILNNTVRRDVYYTVENAPGLYNRSSLPRIDIDGIGPDQVVCLRFQKPPRKLCHELNGYLYFTQSVPGLVLITADGLRFGKDYRGEPDLVLTVLEPL